MLTRQGRRAGDRGQRVHAHLTRVHKPLLVTRSEGKVMQKGRVKPPLCFRGGVCQVLKNKKRRVPYCNFKVFSFSLKKEKPSLGLSKKVSQSSFGQILAVGKTCENIFRAFPSVFETLLLFSVPQDLFRQINVLNPLSPQARLPLRPKEENPGTSEAHLVVGKRTRKQGPSWGGWLGTEERRGLGSSLGVHRVIFERSTALAALLKW